MNLIKELSELQRAHGYLGEAELRALAERLRLPLAEVEAVSSYYPHFRRQPAPPLRVAACRDLCCALRGAEAASAELAALCAERPDRSFERVSCLGRCDQAPACTLNELPVTSEAAIQHLTEAEGSPQAAAPTPRRGWQCDPYGETGGRETGGRETGEHYGVLRAALADDRWGTEDGGVIATVENSGLRGMGGAGFATGVKWRLICEELEPTKYVVCNADESEPGTFKDRVILSELPHLVIEGMILAARAIGAQRGWVFIRHEYEQERAHLEHAIDAAYAAGVLGEKVCGSSFSFDIEIFTSPGGYILGEESALLEALEGHRGEPRNRPPFPAQQGLWGKPTLINNVETLAHIPRIVQTGEAAFRFFSVSGDVEQPGVHEVPASTTVRELIERCGGMRGGAKLAAFMAGGMSGGFLPASRVDISLDWNAPDGVRGVGGVVVVAEGRDLLALAANVVAFFRNESCGKCVPCRLGTEKALQLLARAEPVDFRMIDELHETLRATSLCGLGQVALSPVTTLLSHFPELAGSDT